MHGDNTRNKDMRNDVILAAIVIIGGVCGCQTPKQLSIPTGTYVNAESSDYIKVADNKMSIYLHNITYPFSAAWEVPCRYGLTDDGHIWLNMPGRSAEAAFGVGRFDYWWNGNDIKITDPKTGAVEMFSQKPRRR